MSQKSSECTWSPLSLALTAAVALLSGCTASTSVPVTPPSGWILIDAQPFTFYAPGDMKAVPVQGKDSLAGVYKGSTLTLNFGYGYYSDPMTENKKRPGYAEHTERIDGRKANIVSFHSTKADTFPETVAVHFAKLGKSGGDQIKLTMVATCQTKADVDAAMTIFRTLKFK